MEKNLIGDWAANLSAQEYGKALAALGVLEATGTEQHRPGSNANDILAALKEEVQDGERTALWRGAYNIDGTTAASWQATIHQDTPALVKAWDELIRQTGHLRKRPRLAVGAGWRLRDLFDLESLMGWLGTDDTGCSAVILAPDEVRPEQCRTVWHWPLHVGVPAGEEGRNLLEAFRNINSSWIDQLGLLLGVGEVRDTCDLLILPSGMAKILAEQKRLRLRASFIVCLDEPVPWKDLPDSPQARLREKMGAAGVGLVGASLNAADLYYKVMEQLSHDLQVHAALQIACRQSKILGEPQSLDHLRILAVADRLDRKQEILRQSIPAEPLLKAKMSTTRGFAEMPAEEKSVRRGAFDFQVKSEPETAGREIISTSENLGSKVRGGGFDSEMGYGLPTAVEFGKAKAELEANRRLRHIQACVWREDCGPEPAGGLAAERPSILTVHIGPDTKPRPDPPFPEGQLDFSSGPVAVTVQLELTGAAVVALGKNQQVQAIGGFSLTDFRGDIPMQLFHLLEGLIATPESGSGSQSVVGLASDDITLPVAGDSTRAFFAVRPEAGRQEVRGRIAIIHQNRILETAFLKAAITHSGEEGAGIEVTAEPAVYPRLDDLAERRQFNASLIAADDLGGALRLTGSRDGQSKEINLAALKESLVQIRGILDRAALKWDYNKPLAEQPALRPILYGLASNGCLLFKSLQAELGEETVEGKRIQIVCYGNAFFPLEYVYAGPPPQANAQVCPIFQGQEGGGCQRLQPDSEVEEVDPGADCAYFHSENHLCPFHFWGFSKVIERHRPPAATEKIDADTVKASKLFPVPSHQPFGAINSILYAASNRAFAYCPDAEKKQQEQEKLVESLYSLSPAAHWAASWQEWQEQVKNGPNLLVLIVHTDRKTDELGIATVPVLEIGDGDLLAKHLIDARLIGDPAKVQLLLLIGCSTAEVTEDFAPYHELFRLAGADVILATLSTVRGVDALPMVRKIAELIHEKLSNGKETAFGELLRDLRRSQFAQGFPGVLGLLGFGDADWVLGGSHV